MKKTSKIRPATATPKRRKKKNKIRIRNIVFSFILLILIFALIIAVYVLYLIYRPIRADIPIVESNIVSEGILDDIQDPDEKPVSGADPTPLPKPILWESNCQVRVYIDDRFPIIKKEQKDALVENILLYGIDSRTSSQQKARADSIIIVTLDSRKNEVKLTSVLRDTQVKISGRTQPGKINSAYVFGGVGLLINTINENFDLDIQKFAMVDMWSAEKIIDAMGGIRIRVDSSEIEELNKILNSMNNMFSKVSEPQPYVEGAGDLLLSGRQAIAYSRIRKIGSDIERTARQRKLIAELAESFKYTSINNKISAVNELSKSYETNISSEEMIFLATDFLQMMNTVAQNRIPETGMFVTDNNNWQLIVDMEKQIPSLHLFIWGEPEDVSIGSTLFSSQEVSEGYGSLSESIASESFSYSSSNDIIVSQVFGE